MKFEYIMKLPVLSGRGIQDFFCPGGGGGGGTIILSCRAPKKVIWVLLFHIELITMITINRTMDINRNSSLNGQFV